MNFSNIHGHTAQLQRIRQMVQRRMIPQTLMFSGIDGIGKRLVAMRLLSSFFCTGDASPCGRCTACRQIEKGIHPDFIILSPNQKGVIPIGSEEKKEPGSVRWLIERISRKPITGSCGVILDGIDRIAEEGQNALLKTIEEPPNSTHLVLIAQGGASVLPTILSRCIHIKFYPLGEDDIADMLAGRGIAPRDADAAAALCGGSMSLALHLCDSVVKQHILDLCREISAFLTSGSVFDATLGAAQKYLDITTILDILINIYRRNLNEIIRGGSAAPPEFSGIYLDNPRTVVNLIKILLALKEGQSHNLNIRIGLKGMLYSLYSDANADCPGYIQNDYQHV